MKLQKIQKQFSKDSSTFNCISMVSKDITVGLNLQ